MLEQRLSRRTLLVILEGTVASGVLSACASTAQPTPVQQAGPSETPAVATPTAPPPSPTTAATPVATPTVVLRPAAPTGSAAPIGLPTQVAGSQPVTIRVENTPRPEDRAAYQLWQDKLARFNRLYPNVKIESDPYTFGASTFPARLQGETAGDLWLIPFTEMRKLIEQRAAADVTELMKSWPYYKDWNPGMLEIVRADGERLFGIPAGGYVMGLVYNKVLYQEAGLDPGKPPRSWDDLAAFATKLTNRAKNQAGFLLLTKGGQGGWQFLNFVWQAGGDFEKQEDGRWKAVFDSAEAVRALQFYKDLRWRHDVLPRNLLVTAEDSFPMLASKQAAMEVFAPEWIEIVVTKYGGTLNELAMAALPAGPAGRAEQTGGAIRVINPKSNPEKREAAFWFAIWEEFDLNEVQINTQARALAGKLVGLPGLPLMRGEYQQKYQEIIAKYTNVPLDNYTAYIQEAGQYARPEPPIEAQALYAEALDPVVQAVLTDKNADPRGLLAKAAKEFQTRFLDKVSASTK